MRQLDAIREYISQEGSPHAAEVIVLRLLATISGLAHAPLKGRPSVGGSRELATVRSYLVRYRVSEDVVTVIRIRHGARRPD